MTKKQKTYWAGYTDGKLYFATDYDCERTLPDHACIYRTKKDAKECFEDVRKVKIVEVK